ncbi:hypothetical protein ACFSTE_21105 [Aquimarina hainanensis]|uniref:Uncharacterized protein n=1 Tax=Aquimarina hainanensis TaxID=1578017 RepID=A0ABW5NGI9_9FLAO
MTKNSSSHPVRQKFEQEYGNLNNEELLKELLFSQKLTNQRLEKIRSNTSLLIIIAILPIILGAVLFFMNNGGN